MAVSACSLWGSAFPVWKVTYAERGLGPQDVSERMRIAGASFCLAGRMGFAVQKLLLREPVQVPRGQLPSLRLLGLAQTGLQYYFFYNAIAVVSGIKGAILYAVCYFF